MLDGLRSLWLSTTRPSACSTRSDRSSRASRAEAHSPIAVCTSGSRDMPRATATGSTGFARWLCKPVQPSARVDEACQCARAHRRVEHRLAKRWPFDLRRHGREIRLVHVLETRCDAVRSRQPPAAGCAAVRHDPRCIERPSGGCNDGCQLRPRTPRRRRGLHSPWRRHAPIQTVHVEGTGPARRQRSAMCVLKRLEVAGARWPAARHESYRPRAPRRRRSRRT